MRSKPILINLYGGPGSGKSTVMYEITGRLKNMGVAAEMSPEFVKQKVYSGDKKTFENQLYILGNQSFSQSILIGEVDVIVTDSPLLLSAHYGKNEDYARELLSIAKKFNSSFQEFHFFLRRVKPFCQSGRIHNEEQSREIDKELFSLLTTNVGKDDFDIVNGDSSGTEEIIKFILKELRNNG